MASWTNLTTTYAPTNVIDVNTWNALAGYNGNTQYLYEVLSKYSLEEYYAYGYQADTSFILNSGENYDIEYDDHVDYKPDEVEDQFFDEDSPAYIKIRKSGLYLLAAHANYTTINQNISANYAGMQLYKNNVITDAFVINEQSAPVVSASLLDYPTPLHLFDFQLYNENDVVHSTVRNVNSTEAINIFNYKGNNTSFITTTSFINPSLTSFVEKQTPTFNDNIVAQSPYFTSVYLTTPSTNIDAPGVIFSYTGNYRTELNSNTDPLASVRDAWVSYNSTAAGYLDCTLANNYGTTDNPGTYSPNRWTQQPKTTNDYAYVYPLVDPFSPHSKAIFSALQNADQATGYRYPDYGYMMFAMKSFDIFNAISIHVEQNIFSVHITGIIETSPNIFKRYIIGTPFTFSISKNGTAISMWIRMYEKIKQISFSNLTITNSCIFGLKIGQIINGAFDYSPSLIFNNVEVVTLSSFTTTTTYDMVNTEQSSGTGAHSIGGVDFYSASGASAEKRIYSAIYNITNYKLTDTSYLDGEITTKEKSLVWDNYLNTFNYTPPTYNFTVSESSVGIYFGTFQFGSSERMV